jgi:hypothetical protein
LSHARMRMQTLLEAARVDARAFLLYLRSIQAP